MFANRMRFTPKADMCGATTDVCYGPIATWLICNRRLQWAANADGWAIGSAVKAISPLDTIYYRRRRYRW